MNTGDSQFIILQGWKKPRFLRIFLKVCLDFSVQIRLDTKLNFRSGRTSYTQFTLCQNIFCKI